MAVSFAVNLSGEAEYAFSKQIMPIYDHLQQNSSQGTDWRSMSEDALWSELCLCILSSGVPYEMATSARAHLRRHGLLDLNVSMTAYLEQSIAHELSNPICLPVKKDGNLRRYRFPNVRARCLADSARFLYHEDRCGLHSLMNCSRPEGELRKLMVEHLGGVGFKEASHFLRNVGYSSSLAIIDTHIISFMKKANLIPEATSGVRSRNEYVELESILIEISENNGLDLSTLDMAMWLYMKGR